MKHLTSQEKTTFDEMKEICPWVRHDGECIMLLEDFIGDAGLKGFVDKTNRVFIHEKAYERTKEVVQYNIAANFSLKNGVLEISCPSCGAPNLQRDKANKAKCQSCKREYVVPDKMLNLL